MALVSSLLGRASLAVAGAVVCAGLVLPAPATAGGFGELRFTLRSAPGFLSDVRSNCAQFYVNGLRPREAATTRGGEVGALDVAGRRGEGVAQGSEWQIGQPRRRWLRLSQLGVELDGTRAYVTAIVTRANIPRGPRRRIGVIRRVRIETGLMNDARGRTLTSSYRARIIGRLEVLGPVSQAIRRLSCRGRARRRVAIGDVVGELRVEQRPQRASGVEGVARLTVEPGAASVSVAPTGGSTPDAQGIFVAPIAAGLPVPIVCTLGVECFPSGGAYTVGGGFDLVSGGARASVTGIVVTSSGADVTDVVHTITGSLNGAPVTIVDPAAPDVAAGWTEDFVRRVSAILGVEAYGRLGVRAVFTRTGP
jgi:hypothetical protein